MKCTKCGKEIKDGVKFCSHCGEEVKEVKKAKFCMKCGSKLQEGAVFCSKCGASISTVQEREAIAKPPKQVKRFKKAYIVVGVAVVLFLVIGSVMLNSDRAMYKAYVKFHDEYCEKNAEYEERNDCAARIIMAPGNEKWLSICDITSLRYDGDGDIIEDSIRGKITFWLHIRTM